LAVPSSLDKFAFSSTTFVWEGRYVVNTGDALYGKTSDGDTCDIAIHGYVLSADGS